MSISVWLKKLFISAPTVVPYLSRATCPQCLEATYVVLTIGLTFICFLSFVICVKKELVLFCYVVSYEFGMRKKKTSGEEMLGTLVDFDRSSAHLELCRYTS